MKWLSRTFREMVKVTFTSKYAFPCPNSSIKFNAFHWNYCCVCVCVYIYIYIYIYILCYILWPPALHADTLLSEPPEKPYISQFSSVQSLTHVWLFATPWIEARQASLSITNSRSLLKLMPIKSVMPSSHLIFCHPLLLLPPIPPSIRVFSNESTLHMRWPKYWSFSFNVSPSTEHPGLISFRMDWLDLLVVQGTLKSLLQHHNSI